MRLRGNLDKGAKSNGEVEASSEEEVIGIGRTISILTSEIAAPVPASEEEVGEVALRAEISVVVALGAKHHHRPIRIIL